MGIGRSSHWDDLIYGDSDANRILGGFGEDVIDGRSVVWCKMTDGLNTIELVFGEQAQHHISFTVDQIDERKYYYTAPSGHRIQFDRDPSGNLIEYVEKEVYQ